MSTITYEPEENVEGSYVVLRDGVPIGKAYKATAVLWAGAYFDGIKVDGLRRTRAEIATELEAHTGGLGAREPGRLRKRILAKRAAEREARGEFA